MFAAAAVASSAAGGAAAAVGGGSGVAANASLEENAVKASKSSSPPSSFSPKASKTSTLSLPPSAAIVHYYSTLLCLACAICWLPHFFSPSERASRPHQAWQARGCRRPHARSRPLSLSINQCQSHLCVRDTVANSIPATEQSRARYSTT